MTRAEIADGIGHDLEAKSTGHRQSLRVAMVGAGRMARNHAKAIRDTQHQVRIVALADPDAEARQGLQELCPDATTFDTLTALLRAEDVNVVHVCSPAGSHARLATEALEAGCHVYVEKPFAKHAVDAEGLIALAARRGLQVCAGHQLLFEKPALQTLTKLPAISPISHLESYFGFRQAPDTGGTRTAEEQLLDIMPHPVYLLLRFLLEAAPDSAAELVDARVSAMGTIHAAVSRGPVTGNLVITLSGRPVESYVKVVGSNGTLHADFVRGTVQQLIGPGTSGIDKALNPFRLARQMVFGTTTSLANRIFRHQRSYPGLAELFEAFYEAIRTSGDPPLPGAHLVETTRICEGIASVIRPAARGPTRSATSADTSLKGIAVTGGTGFLGSRVVRYLADQGRPVTVVARRLPPFWEDELPGECFTADLSTSLPRDLLENVTTVVHCAAETAGGWQAHERNSVAATENVVRAAAAAGVKRVVHVSSLAVFSSDAVEPLNEESPLEPGRRMGPYVWGKAESERQAEQLADELGLELIIVRPGPLIYYRQFDPPGRLGRRIGNLFVAFGSKADPLYVIDVEMAARIIGDLSLEDSPSVGKLNLVQPQPPTKAELVRKLKARNPGLRVLWFPRWLLLPTSFAAKLLQRVLRPSREPIDLAAAVAIRDCHTGRMADLVQLPSPVDAWPGTDSEMAVNDAQQGVDAF